MEEFQLMLLWSNLFGFRLLVTIMPQYGLVTKEEFNYPESVAGILGLEQEGMLGVENKQLIVPYLTAGIPFAVLKFVSSQKLFNGIISPYSVLMVPRLWMAVCSIIIDVCIYKTASNVGCSKKSGLVAMTLFSGSYISWIYMARTLPVAVNTILYSVVLCVITECLSNEENTINVSDNIRTALIIGVSIFLGVAADVTFLDFSVVPIILWLCYSQFLIKTVSRKLFSFFVSLLLLLSAIVLANLNMSNGANSRDFSFSNLSSYRCFLKPFNDVTPRFDEFHNITSKIASFASLLLTVMGPLMIPLSRIPQSIKLNDVSACIQRCESVLMCSLVSAFFSFILMKDRDYTSILPTIVPAVILVAKHQRISKKFVICYGLFNTFAFTYNGTYKYSGAIHSMNFLGSMVEPLRHYRVNDVVFYATPILPKYLLAMPCDYDAISAECTASDYLDLRFIDADSESLPEILDALLYNKPDFSVLLVLPGSVSCKFISKINTAFNLQLFYRCFPHVISLEYIPDYSNPREWCRIRGGYFDYFSDLIYEKFSLNIYAVGRQKPARTNSVEITEKLTTIINNYCSSI